MWVEAAAAVPYHYYFAFWMAKATSRYQNQIFRKWGPIYLNQNISMNIGNVPNGGVWFFVYLTVFGHEGS